MASQASSGRIFKSLPRWKNLQNTRTRGDDGVRSRISTLLEWRSTIKLHHLFRLITSLEKSFNLRLHGLTTDGILKYCQPAPSHKDWRNLFKRSLLAPLGLA
jgi:predicted nucleotidyltransferase